MINPALILIGTLYLAIVTGGEVCVALFGNGTFFNGANLSSDVSGLIGTNCHFLDVAFLITATANLYTLCVFWTDQRKNVKNCTMKVLYGISGFLFFGTRVWLSFPFVNEYILHYNKCTVLNSGDPIDAVMHVNTLVSYLLVAEVGIFLLWIVLGVPYAIVVACKRRWKKKQTTYEPSNVTTSAKGIYTASLVDSV
jgi:hypothetical protein